MQAAVMGQQARSVVLEDVVVVIGEDGEGWPSTRLAHITTFPALFPRPVSSLFETRISGICDIIPRKAQG